MTSGAKLLRSRLKIMANQRTPQNMGLKRLSFNMITFQTRFRLALQKTNQTHLEEKIWEHDYLIKICVKYQGVHKVGSLLV